MYLCNMAYSPVGFLDITILILFNICFSFVYLITQYKCEICVKTRGDMYLVCSRENAAAIDIENDSASESNIGTSSYHESQTASMTVLSPP